MEFPEPVIEHAIEPKTKAGQGKMGEALAKLEEEDPTFRAHTDQETGQTIIAGMGELHLEIIVDRLLREFKVEANVGAPQVAYKETFTKPVDVEYKYAKQSGGRGQYGHCKVRFEPMVVNGEETFKFDINCFCEGFFVCYLWSTNVSFYFELTKETVNDDLKVKLTHTSDDCLSCFLICMSSECRIFFSQFCKCFRHFP